MYNNVTVERLWRFLPAVVRRRPKSYEMGSHFIFMCVERIKMIEKNDVFGRFFVVRKMSFGGMSEIYEVNDFSSKSKWAMKVTDASDKRKADAALREVKVLKTVSHPSLPRIVDCFEENGYFCVIMDYIDGYNLKNMVEDYGGLKEKDAIKIGIKLSMALEYLHSKGFIYRDLKPSNVMITKEGYIRLVDFGLTSESDGYMPNSEFYLTKEYAPPELLAGKCGDERSDVYELGTTLFYICEKKKRSAGFKRFCKKCMKRNEKDRFQSAAEATMFLKRIESYNRNVKRDLSAALIWGLLGITALLTALFLGSGT